MSTVKAPPMTLSELAAESRERAREAIDRRRATAREGLRNAMWQKLGYHLTESEVEYLNDNAFVMIGGYQLDAKDGALFLHSRRGEGVVQIRDLQELGTTLERWEVRTK
jgi:hypothetical protein